MGEAGGPSRSTFSMRTGVAHLRSFPASVLLDLALQQADPKVLITPILHEIIHHACANTAVNVALQNRWLELLRSMMSSPALGWAIYEDQIELAQDLAFVEATLQPLAEGIAHFAEFDCAVPESRMGRGYMLGPTDALLWRLLSLKAGAGSHMDELFGILQAEQIDARTVTRKTDVLCNPIHPLTGNDSYLLGYLTIKSLWNRFLAGQPEARFRAPSFLNFVAYYIYEDWGLARILMSPGRIDLEVVASRVAARVKELFASDVAAKVAAFIDDMDARSRERGTLMRGPEEIEHGPFLGLDLTADEMRAGMLATIRFHSERVGPGAALNPAQKIQGLSNLQYNALMTEMDPALPYVAELIARHRAPAGRPVHLLDFVLEIPQQKRAFCYLMDVAVEIRGGGGDQLLLSIPGVPGSGRALQAAAAARFSDSPQSGRLFGVIASTDIPWRFYCFLLCDEAVVCSWLHGSDVEDVEEFQRLARTIVNEVQMERSTQLSFPKLNEHIMRNEKAQAQVSERADAATQAIAAGFRSILSGAGWSGLVSKNSKQDFGLRNVVPRMSDVKCLAAAGLCNSLRRERPEMENLMQAAGYRLSDALEASAKTEKDSGVTLVREEGELVYVQV